MFCFLSLCLFFYDKAKENLTIGEFITIIALCRDFVIRVRSFIGQTAEPNVCGSVERKNSDKIFLRAHEALHCAVVLNLRCLLCGCVM